MASDNPSFSSPPSTSPQPNHILPSSPPPPPPPLTRPSAPRTPSSTPQPQLAAAPSQPHTADDDKLNEPDEPEFHAHQSRFIHRTGQSDIRIALPSSTPRRYSMGSIHPSKHTHSDIDSVLLGEAQADLWTLDLDAFCDRLLPLPDQHCLAQPPPALYDATNHTWIQHPGLYDESTFGPFLETLARSLVEAVDPVRSFHYCRRREGFAGGTASVRRPDFYVANKLIPDDSERIPSWSEVIAVGELSKPAKTAAMVLVQLAGYAREVFCAQRSRRFIPAFYLHHDLMTLYHFDRGGTIRSATAFDIRKEWSRLALVLRAYATLPDHRVGLDGNLRLDDGTGLWHVNAGGQEFAIQETIFIRESLIGRATACWVANSALSNDIFVIKDSWRPSQQVPESAMYQLANEFGVPGIAILHSPGVNVEWDGMIDDICNLRGGSLMSGHGGSDAVATTPSDPSSSAKRQRTDDDQAVIVPNRIHTRLVLRAALGTPISGCETALEFFPAIRDAMQCSLDLYQMAGILHRDISPDNILCTTASTELTVPSVSRLAFLIDFDYAITMDNPNSGANQITGKVAYLALSVVDGFPNTLRADMESFFYVICHIATTYARSKDIPVDQWHGVDPKLCAAIKRSHMRSRRGFKDDVLSYLADGFGGAETLMEEMRLLVTTTGKHDLPGPQYDEAITAMESGGRATRLRYMAEENESGIELGRKMIGCIDVWLASRLPNPPALV